MKAAVSNYVLLVLLCVTVLFVSMAVADEVAQDKPLADGNFEAELASGRCIHGCCNRNFIGKCKVCCPAPASEEAKAAMAELSHGLGARRAGAGAAGEAKEKEAKP